ncbi:hypothetical protein D5278_04780 [bacterium 1XD21-13]|nr:hypothetical protein [bacterium 1XD21-13]
MGYMLLFFLFLGLMLIPGPLFTIWNIRNLLLHREHTGKFEAMVFAVGILYSLLLYGLWSPRSWEESIYINQDMSVLHEPFSRAHILTLLALMAVGLISYAYLKSKKGKAAPLAAVLSMSGVYLGILVNLAVILQLLGGALADIPFGNVFPGDVLLLMLVPFNYLMLAVNLLIQVVRDQSAGAKQRETTMGYDEGMMGSALKADRQEPYKSHFLNDCSRILSDSGHWALYALLLTLPLLCIMIAVLLLFGQQPDSAIRAFTETSDWALSARISPPPVVIDSHYLCTVALRGHKGLVKPKRLGLRRGSKIVVNRQLCVANAFEQLLEERTPRFHRALRSFYDNYGYPISKHIRTPLSADMIYLVMKPLEWLFVAVLYLFDEKPEDRIARQYLPL